MKSAKTFPSSHQEIAWKQCKNDEYSLKRKSNLLLVISTESKKLKVLINGVVWFLFDKNRYTFSCSYNNVVNLRWNWINKFFPSFFALYNVKKNDKMVVINKTSLRKIYYVKEKFLRIEKCLMSVGLENWLRNAEEINFQMKISHYNKFLIEFSIYCRKTYLSEHIKYIQYT